MTLFGYLEVEDEEKWEESSTDAINCKWRDYMADIIETNPDNTAVSSALKQVFHMD